MIISQSIDLVGPPRRQNSLTFFTAFYVETPIKVSKAPSTLLFYFWHRAPSHPLTVRSVSVPASGSTAAALFFLPRLWLEHTRCPYSSRNLTSNFKQIHTNTYYTYTIHTLYWNDSPCTRLTCIRKETGVQNSFLINIATGEGKAGSKRFRWLDICQLSFFGAFSWTGTKWVNYATSGNKTGNIEKPIRMQDALHFAYSRSQPFNNVTHDHDQFMNAAIAKARSYIPAKMKRWSEWVCDHETPFLFRSWW